MLPPIGEHIQKRPGVYASKIEHYIPDKDKKFWEKLYKVTKGLDGLQFPIKRGNREIDAHFGYFGFRFHPIKHKSNYFHVGIDIPNRSGTLVYPIAPGIFEYSGFNETNGKYVLLSHPEIKTEDGFVLYSLYMHLSKFTVKFTRRQKFLREISFHTYPLLPIKATRALGRVGKTGNIHGTISHVHVQMEFRKKDIIVAVDPLLFFGMKTKENKSMEIETPLAFSLYRKVHYEELAEWEQVWKGLAATPSRNPKDVDS